MRSPGSRWTAVGPQADTNDGKRHLRLKLDAESMDLWFRSMPAVGAVTGEVGLALALLPAMRQGGTLRIDLALSPRLLRATDRIQDVFLMWERADVFPRQRFRRVVIDADQREQEGQSSAGVGCFFSGGVDSFYTALKHREEITDLILIHGFDMPLDNPSLRHETSLAAHAVAEGLGKRLIEVETNVRTIADRHLTWHHFFGAGLASVALFLSPHLRKVFIPGAHTYSNLVPDGSHPLLDPLWSTEHLEIVYDGLEATRTDKVARLVKNDLAMRWLRVCWENRDGAYNCGRCEKCLRTLISLHAAGARDRCTTLPGPIDLGAVAGIKAGHTRSIWVELLRDLEVLQADPALVGAVRAVAVPKRLRAVRAGWRSLRRVASRLGRARS